MFVCRLVARVIEYSCGLLDVARAGGAPRPAAAGAGCLPAARKEMRCNRIAASGEKTVALACAQRTYNCVYPGRTFSFRG